MGALARAVAEVNANEELRKALRGSVLGADPLSRLEILRTADGVVLTSDELDEKVVISWARLEQIWVRDGVPYPESLRRAIGERLCLGCLGVLPKGEAYNCGECRVAIRDDLAALLDELQSLIPPRPTGD